MTAPFLYAWVLATAREDRHAAVQALNDKSLCRLSGWLALSYSESDATGEVLGMCLVEQAERFAKTQDFKMQDARAEEQRRKVREVMG